MQEALETLRADVATCRATDKLLRGQAAPDPSTEPPTEGPNSKAPVKDAAAPLGRPLSEVLQTCVQACRDSRKRHREETGSGPDLSDEALSQYTRFTDKLALQDYSKFLHYVPRLVNVVSKYQLA